MSTTLEKFTAQISEEFLTCKICYEPFLHPKCLSCLHTFCKSCIESHLLLHSEFRTYSRYREFSCPICRKKTQIPLGGVGRLQDNFIVSNLSDLVCADRSIETDKTLCSFCSQLRKESIPAVMKCIECQKLLCGQCSDQHQQNQLFITHDLYELSIEQDIVCPRHSQETVRYFCDDCNQCVCIVCACGDATDLHLNHNLVNFKSAAKERRPALIKSLKQCKDKQETLLKHLNTLISIQEMIDSTKKCITSTATKFHKKIDDDKETTLSSVETFVNLPTRQLMEKIPEFNTLKEQFNNTCSLTELMLAGNDIELLLMIDQLSEKLNTLYNHEMLLVSSSSLAEADAKRKFEFTEGEVMLGSVAYCKQQHQRECSADMDQQKNNVGVQTNGNDRIVENASVSTQTSDPFLSCPLENNAACNVENIHNNRNNNGDDLGRRNKRLNKFHKSNTFTTLPVHNNSPERKILDSKEENRDGSVLANDIRGSTMTYTDMRRVRRLVKKNCSVAALPNMDTIILDPESNCMSILDKKGKVRYFLSENIFADPFSTGINGFSSPSLSDCSTPRQVTVTTSQGILTISFKECKEAKLPLAFTVHAYNSICYRDNNKEHHNL
ncbi:hypothetical protein GJ496_007336 [Pomphorhynchus laevis]|nr:hypothetical protein GJ496_007336 [Pomphorhynchus laevis]